MSAERRREVHRWVHERTVHEGLTAREIANVSGIYDDVPKGSDRCFDDLTRLALPERVGGPKRILRKGRPARWFAGPILPEGVANDAPLTQADERRLIEVIVGPCSRDSADKAAMSIEGWLSEGFPGLGAAVGVRYSLDSETEDMDMGPFDPDELVRWAVLYGHPEGWCKRAQAAHARAEKAQARLVEVERERDELVKLVREPGTVGFERRRAEEYREALAQLVVASEPYVTQAAHHEELFNGEDLQNYQKLIAAKQRASGMLSSHPKGTEASDADLTK